MWLLFGKEEIIEAYENQKKWNKKHINFSDLSNNKDVRIAVPKNEISFLSKFKIQIGDEAIVKNKMEKIAARKKVVIFPSNRNNTPTIDSSTRLAVGFHDLFNIQSKNIEYIIEGDVANLISYSLNLLLENAKHYSETANLFTALFREIISNAFAHRSYEIDLPNKLYFSKNKICVSSPGGLPKELSMEAFLQNKYVATRNPKLVYDLVKLRVMDNIGVGMHRIESIASDLNILNIKYTQVNEYFVVEIEF
jgi:hypothetical protein